MKVLRSPYCVDPEPPSSESFPSYVEPVVVHLPQKRIVAVTAQQETFPAPPERVSLPAPPVSVLAARVPSEGVVPAAAHEVFDVAVDAVVLSRDPVVTGAAVQDGRIRLELRT